MKGGEVMASINVNCTCGNQFVTEEPSADSGFTVECPTCGARIRIKPPGISHKQYKAATAPSVDERIANRIRKYETVSGILWLIIGAVQLALVWTAAAGVWNIINAIMRLRSVKSIYAGNPAIVPWYDSRRNWLIAFAIVNLVLGGVIGVFLVAFDWWMRDYVLRNRAVFEGTSSQSA
jgi:DNA-directed RNA polymerase subunit RPC12/RpoP